MPEPDTHTPIQRLRAPAERWKRFGEVVGNRGRSADLNAYMEARINGTDMDSLSRALRRWIAADPAGAFEALAPYMKEAPPE